MKISTRLFLYLFLLFIFFPGMQSIGESLIRYVHEDLNVLREKGIVFYQDGVPYAVVDFGKHNPPEIDCSDLFEKSSSDFTCNPGKIRSFENSLADQKSSTINFHQTPGIKFADSGISLDGALGLFLGLIVIAKKIYKKIACKKYCYCNVPPNPFTQYDEYSGYMKLQKLSEFQIASLYKKLRMDQIALKLFEQDCKNYCKYCEIGRRLKAAGFGCLSHVQKEKLYELLHDVYVRHNFEDQQRVVVEVNPDLLYKNASKIDIKEIKKYAYKEVKTIAKEGEYVEYEVAEAYVSDGISYFKKYKVLEKRNEAIKKVIKSKGMFYKKTYVVSKKAKTVFKKYGVDARCYKELKGNALQQQLHREFLDIAESTYDLEYHGNGGDQVDSLKKLVVEFDDIGRSHNTIGSVINALNTANFCWSMLEYGKAFIAGAVEGVIDTANFFLHPVDSVLGIGTAIVFAGAFLAEVVFNSVGVYAGAILSEDLFEICANNLAEKVNIVADIMEKAIYETDGPQKVKFAARAIVAIALGGRANRAVLKYIKQAGKDAAKFLPLLNREKEFVAAAEGINIPIVSQMMDVVKEGAGRAGKAAKKLIKKSGKALQKRSNKLGRCIEKVYLGVDNSEVAHIIKKFGSKFKLPEKVIEKLGTDYVIAGESYWKHIFGLEINIIKNSSGILKEVVGGFHHDPMLCFAQKGYIRFKDVIMHKKTGVFQAKMLYKGKVIKKVQTFFSPNWSREKIADKIIESFKKIDSSTIREQHRWGNVRIRFEALTREGLRIMHVIEKGKLITSFPVF